MSYTRHAFLLLRLSTHTLTGEAFTLALPKIIQLVAEHFSVHEQTLILSVSLDRPQLSESNLICVLFTSVVQDSKGHAKDLIMGKMLQIHYSFRFPTAVVCHVNDH